MQGGKVVRRHSYVLGRAFSSRKSFGSFHSEDIEELIQCNPFPIPSIFQEIHQLTMQNLSSDFENIKFGKDFKKKFYMVDDSWTFINHGAFGGTLKPILEESHKWRMHIESQPLKFFDRDLFALQCHSLHSLAKLLNTSPLQLLPIPNVTAGLNAIFQSYQHLPPTKAKEIVYLSLTYGSTKKIVQDFVARTKESHQYTAKMIHIPLPIPSRDHLIQQITSQITTSTKMIILDHITSNTAIEMPIFEIAKLCKSINPNIVIVIDAAHSLFSQPTPFHYTPPTSSTTSTSTSTSAIKECLSQYIDFWISNGHKWLSSGKGSAILWRAPHCQYVRPTIISHGYLAGGTENTFTALEQNFPKPEKVLSAFSWDGCRDYVPFITMPSTINIWDAIASHFHSDVSERKIDPWNVYRKYIGNLLTDAEGVLRNEWQLTDDYFISDISLRENLPMRLIPLPTRNLFPSNTKDHKYTDNEAFQLQELLHHKYNIEVPLKCIEGKLYARISAHVYNELDDYVHFANVLKNIHN